MGRTKGTYTLTSNIEPKVGAPLDARTIVKLLADLTASNTFEYPYKGMRVFVEENNKSYTLVGSDPTVSTNWIEDNSGGHTIKNPAGTAMTQRSNLQFVDLTVSDDSTNDATKVESIHVIQSESELENLPDGLYMLDDDEDTIIDGNLVGYDNTDSELNAENVQDAIDEIVEALDDKIDISTKGVANGVAELDSAGKVPSSQLPSYVDDVIEVSDYDHLPATGETGKIYVTLDTNKTYRWGGTEYVEISKSLALGETSSTAYRGDRGKTAYDHSQITSGNPHNVTKSDVGLSNVNNTSDKNKPLSDATKEALLMKIGIEAITHYYEPNMVVEMSRYAEGSNIYVESEGRMYRATTDINIGETLIPDTNCVPVDIQYMIMEKLGVDNLTTVVELVDRASSAHSMYSRFYIAYLNKWAKATANIAVNDMLVMGTNYEIVTIEDVFGSIESVLSQMSTSISNKVNKETGKGLSTNDYTATDKNKVSKIDTTTTSISGNPISISGLKANQLAVNPIITLEPIQAGSGTPSPSNIRAISGYDKIEVSSCGKNLINVVKANTAVNNNGEEYTNNACCLSNGIYIKQGISYYVSWQNKSADLIVQKYKDNIYIGYVRLNDVRVFSFNDCNLVKLQWNGADTTTGAVLPTNPQCEEGSTSTTYEAPHKTTDLSESLGQTVYGGTLDVRSGKLTSNLAIADMGDLNYSYNSTYGFFQTDGLSNRKYGANITCISSCYEDVGDKSASDMANVTHGKMASNNNTVIIKFKNTSYTDATAFKTAMAGQKIVYEVATPTEIQLTPHEISLLKDYAYVSTNGTNISLDYHNGELASLADVSQLGETVNEGLDCLKDYVEANYRGDNINISGYSGSNKYTIPNDGYINVDSQSSTSGYARVVVQDSDGHNLAFCYMNVTAAYQIQSVFVRKGMLAYVQANTSNASITYVPLA